MSVPRGEKRGDGCQSLVFLARAHSSFTKKPASYCAVQARGSMGLMEALTGLWNDYMIRWSLRLFALTELPGRERKDEQV